MKAKLTFSPELVDLIADRVIGKLKPLLQPHQIEDSILTLDEVSKLMGKSDVFLIKKIKGADQLGIQLKFLK